MRPHLFRKHPPAQINPAAGLTGHAVYDASRALHLIWQWIEIAALRHLLAGRDVIDRLCHTSARVALRGGYIQMGEPSVTDSSSRINEFLDPPDRLVLFDPNAEE